MKSKIFFIVGLIIFISISLLTLTPHNFNKANNFISFKIDSYLAKKQNEKNFKNLKNCFINKKFDYSKNILVIGHAYGVSDENNRGIYPKLKVFLQKNNVLYDLIVLTGDVARNPSIENYNIILEELSSYGKQILISPGNHDVGNNKVNYRRKIFKEYFKRFYDHKVIDNNLFIALDNTINYTVDKGQFDWMKLVIRKNINVENIFIFTHHVPWKNKVENQLLLNDQPQSEIVQDYSNYLIDFDEAMIFLDELDKGIFYVAGSVNNYNYLFCEKNKKITYLNSGVGINKVSSLIEIKIKNKQIKLSYKLF